MNRTFSLEEIEEVVNEFLKEIPPTPLKGGGTVLGFSGNLGAGKTTFTKKLLEKMGHTGGVPSPTFVLRRDYEIPLAPLKGGNSAKVIHIDAYRLEKPEHLFQVISQDELDDKNNLVIIEWPEKVDAQVFDQIFLFEHVDENTRKISKK